MIDYRILNLISFIGLIMVFGGIFTVYTDTTLAITLVAAGFCLALVSYLLGNKFEHKEDKKNTAKDDDRES